ncbi:LADA_0D05314g1_1 [Lachancea dasiensis]|uniref:LADA_0D05314g1_1 n=1 Tax=Lachancea dasiensis TaxID=1072105 RepID=A0A1G4J5N4_9SACH|nr:LADA_0D05314g1_1 [Lachancea dasiensis]
MSYQGESQGNRPQYNSYRGSSYRGKSYRGGRGGYHATRYQHTYGYEESGSRYASSSGPHRGSYRGDYYTPPLRGNYSSVSRGGYSDSSPRYEKGHQSSGWSTRGLNVGQVDRASEDTTHSSTSSAASPKVNTALPKIHSTDSPIYHLTGLHDYAEDEQERSMIRALLREDENIDARLEEQKLQLCKSELELGLLSTQSEKDALNVRLTQENLDALLLMQ